MEFARTQKPKGRPNDHARQPAAAASISERLALGLDDLQEYDLVENLALVQKRNLSLNSSNKNAAHARARKPTTPRPPRARIWLWRFWTCVYDM